MLSDLLKDKKIILGSASPRRQDLLKSIINDFEIKVSDLKEKYPKSLKEKEISEFLAIQKSDIFSNDLNTYNSATMDNKFYIAKTLDIKMPKNTNNNSNNILLYNDFRNSETSINTFDFWNASLAYRKDQDSKWEYEVKATNLLNTNSQNNTSNNALFVSSTEYFIQPRFVTFRVIYSL